MAIRPGPQPHILGHIVYLTVAKTKLVAVAAVIRSRQPILSKFRSGFFAHDPIRP